MLAGIVLIAAGTLLLVAPQILVWSRPAVDASLRSPVIERQLPNSTDIPSAAQRKGSVTDLLLDYPLEQAEHPLDPLLLVAEAGLKYMRENVRDYTATLVKQERIGNRLYEEEFLFCKVRHGQDNLQATVPHSVYLKFLKPRSLSGREVIWVQGQRDGKLIAHEGGLLNVITATLDPNGRLAMMGNRYPISELGMENLIVRLIEKGRRDRAAGTCRVEVDRSLTIDGYSCTMLTITNPEQRPPYDYFQAKIYINDELNVPIGFEGYHWPAEPGGAPQLVEKYVYTDVKLNCGLSDKDFDPNNKQYDFR